MATKYYNDQDPADSSAGKRKPSLPRVRFLEGPPPELYDQPDWRALVAAWRKLVGAH